jgi:molybdenum cofactor cytidylyltransferase
VRLAAALLAAGGSTRFGPPKAFLPFRGQSLLRGLALELATVADPVVVVAPPGANAFARELAGSGAELIVNPWAARGMGSSLAAAVRALVLRAPEVDALLVALVDQPLVDRDLLKRLVHSAANGSGWAACDYGDAAIGPPAILPRAAFEALARLDGERGARDLLAAAGARVARVDFPGGRWDVDTPADYERLLAFAAGRGGGSDAG